MLNETLLGLALAIVVSALLIIAILWLIGDIARCLHREKLIKEGIKSIDIKRIDRFIEKQRKRKRRYSKYNTKS